MLDVSIIIVNWNASDLLVMTQLVLGVATAPPEAPYSVFQIVGLAAVCFTLMLAGALAFDVVRNIWSFDQPYSASSSLMSAIISAFGL